MVATGLLHHCGKKKRERKWKTMGIIASLFDFLLKFKRKNNLLFKYMLFKTNALKVEWAVEKDIFKRKKHFNS